MLTVKDLIIQLQSLPQNLEVAIVCPDNARGGEFVHAYGAMIANTSDMNWDGDPDFNKDVTLVVIE